MMQSGLLHLLMIVSLVSSTSLVLGINGCNITSVYQLGDSHTDTGNFVRLGSQASPFSTAARPPYGKTYGMPNGRYSDGLLIIDYMAKALSLPLIDPYLAENISSKNGIVFSVAGSTALNTGLLTLRGIISPVIPNVPLYNQLVWFKKYLSSTCASPTDCVERLKTSVVFLGEIGENDFSYSFLEGQSIEQATTNVPLVVSETIHVARQILNLGATKMVVFGDFPTGCFPSYLTTLQTTNSSAYDDNGCLIEYNNFQIYRNNYLNQSLTSLRTEFPNATIIYGDNYNAFKHVLNNAASLGFDPNVTQKACCGKGGEYNFDLTMICGTLNYNVCPNPNLYISWDGVHMTQHAYYHMAQYLIGEIFPQLSCSVNPSTY